MKELLAWLARRNRMTPRIVTLKAIDSKSNVLATCTIVNNDVEVAGQELLQDVTDDCMVHGFDEGGNPVASCPVKYKKPKEEKDSGKKTLDERMARLVTTTFDGVQKHNEDNFKRSQWIIEREDAEISDLRAQLKERDARILELTVENLTAKHAAELEAAKVNPETNILGDTLKVTIGEAMANAPAIMKGIIELWEARGAANAVPPERKIDENAKEPVTVVSDNEAKLPRAQRLRILLRKLPDTAVDEVVAAIGSNKAVTKRVMTAIAPHVDGVEGRRLIDDYMAVES